MPIPQPPGNQGCAVGACLKGHASRPLPLLLPRLPPPHRKCCQLTTTLRIDQATNNNGDNYINIDISIKDPDVGALAFHLIVLQDARVLHAKGIAEHKLLISVCGTVFGIAST
ncbi:uncharacterized protein LOC108101983 isoform X1 [Drosophila ficusphila]|uniref:uncharacterized protein LOC108101983 isoform X1 n=1 Tax=Drosophila ficusphila TaxID=30025 RepID=UPI0007E6DCEB|nr:uncharacterized protein LOC108101983 isoform X1 [Drosophila ficusphila]